MGYHDMDLDDQVKAAIRRDGRLSKHRIGVSVKNGIVYLKGDLTAREHKRALELIRNIESVAAVVDEMNQI